jgi:hypothetical protein
MTLLLVAQLGSSRKLYVHPFKESNYLFKLKVKIKDCKVKNIKELLIVFKSVSPIKVPFPYGGAMELTLSDIFQLKL